MGDSSSRAFARRATATPFEHVIAANNQRLFRTAWSILKDRAEAEEAVQAAYLSAFAKSARSKAAPRSPPG